MARRLLVAHASHLLARGYLVVSTDRKHNAIFAATSALVRAFSFKQPELAVAVIDDGLDKTKLPAPLAQQLEAFPSVLEAHGLHLVRSTRPADLVASYTNAALDDGCDVVIVGSDKRFAQLVGDRVWWYDAYKDVRYTPELVRKRFEVSPAHVAGWLALVGDDDTLPGVTGLGKKGATDLVTAFGSIEAAIENAGAAEGRPGKMLRASIDEAKKEVARAHLDLGQSLPVPLSELEYRVPIAAALNELYGSLGFFELLGSESHADKVEVVVCSTPEATRAALDALGDEPTALFR